MQDGIGGEYYVYINFGYACGRCGIGMMKTPPEYDCGDEITVELDLLSKRPNVKFFRNGDKKVTTENQLFIKKKGGPSKYQLVVVVYHKDVRVSLIKMTQEFEAKH